MKEAVMGNLRLLIAFVVVCFSGVKPLSYDPSDYLEVYPDPMDPEVLKGRTPLYFALIQSLGRPPSQFDGSGSVAGVKVALDRINNDSSLLPGYTLHYTFTDSACDRTTSLDALHYQLLHEPRKLAVVGAGCSVATEPTAEISHYYNITQISCVSSSATLRDRLRYPKYFQLLSSAESLAYGFYGVIREYGWKRVALIVQDENQFTITMRHLKGLLVSGKVDYNESIFSTSSGIAGLGSDIFDRQSRIFLLAMYESHARRLLCEAYKQEIYLPRSMLMTNGLYTSFWWQIQEPDVTCTVAQRERVLLSTLAVTHFDSQTVINMETTLEITGTEFLSEERKFLRQPPLNISDSRLSQYCHDATWTLAYALNNTINSLKDASTNERIAESFNLTSPFTLEEFSYNSNELLKVIFGHLENTSFYGITGPVRFERHGIRELQELITYQYRRKLNVIDNTIHLDAVEIGTVNPGNFSFSYTAEENLSTVWNDFEVPFDGVPRRRFVSVHVALSVILILLSCGGIVLAIVCLIFNFVFRKTKLIRLASSRLNFLIGIGAILIYIGSIVQAIPTTYPDLVASICHTSTWLSSIGYSLCYGTILVKVARVYYIFNGPTMWKKAVPDTALLLSVACFVGIDFVILLSYIIRDAVQGSLLGVEVRVHREKPTVIEKGPQETVTNNLIYVCHATASGSYLGVLYAYKLLLVVIGLLLAFAIRKVKVKGLNDSAYIVAATYVISTVLITIIIATYALREYINALATVYSTGFQAGTTAILLLTFVPQMLNLYKDPKGDNLLHGLSGATKATTTKETEIVDVDEVEGLKKRILKVESEIRIKEELLAILMKADPISIRGKSESVLLTQCSSKLSNYSEEGIHGVQHPTSIRGKSDSALMSPYSSKLFSEEGIRLNSLPGSHHESPQSKIDS